MALAFFAYVLWLRLADAGRLGLRAALFVPLSLLLWTWFVDRQEINQPSWFRARALLS